MSYLDVPRLHFFGEFWADPSTFNNTLGTCCDPGAAPPSECSYDPGASSHRMLWNPNGSHWFFLQNCTVRRALDTSGAVKQTTAQDGLIGGEVETTNTPNFAKLVDLDPEFQTGSQIWGLELQVSLASGGGHFKGKMKRATLRDTWFGRVPSLADPFARGIGGVYQSVLTGVTWDTSSTSPIFNALRGVAGQKLSIKFVLYSYDDRTTSATFNNGKVVGTIGPYMTNEPDHFLAARSLESTGSGAFGAAPFKVDTARNKVVIDLGNSVPEATPGGSRVNHGTMRAAIRIPAGWTNIGTIDYSKAHYERTAGVEEINITPAKATLLANKPLGIFRTNPSPQLVLAEKPGGMYVNATEIVLRLNPGDNETIELVATEFGSPKSGQSLGLRLLGGAPSAALTIPPPVNTGGNGRASFTFTAGDPGHPRPHIDGELYTVGYYWGSTASPSNQRGLIRVLVFDSHPVPANPTWTHVEPILKEYARLYSWMRSRLDIGVHATYATQANRDIVKATLSYPEKDPRYMPVTRDLSRDKKDLIIRWLDNGAP